MKLYLVYTDTDILLSKRVDTTGRNVEDAHASFKTSLGPWVAAEVIAFLADEYPGVSPLADVQVAEFLASPNESVRVRFD